MPNLKPPASLGLPAFRFPAWRPAQEKALIRTLEDERRFIANALPTGVGKTAVGVGLQRIQRVRAIYLTSTKALEDQLIADFVAGLEHPLLADIRGKVNYRCLVLEEMAREDATATASAAAQDDTSSFPSESAPPVRLSVDAGPCNVPGYQCDRRSECSYYRAIDEAVRLDLVVTNYAKWLTYPNLEAVEQELGRVDLLILDEAHKAQTQLENAVQVTMTYKEMDRFLSGEPHPGVKEPAGHWIQWGSRGLRLLQAHYAGVQAEIQMLHKAGSHIAGRGDRGNGSSRGKLFQTARELRNLIRKMERLAKAQGRWVVEQTGRGYFAGVTAAPVWPAAYAEPLLFKGVKQVVFMSATMRPKTLELLGLKPSEYLFMEAPSPFRISRRPVRYVKSPRLSRSSPPEVIQEWLTLIAQLVEARADRKGVIFTVSYERASQIANFLVRWKGGILRDLVMTHTTETAQEALVRFKRRSDPAVFLSPSITTGVDFPFTDAEYGIAAKMPFVNPTGALMQARVKEDPEYADHLVAEEIVQEGGRGMRDGRDQFEFLIVDGHFWWFIWAKRHLFAKYFVDAVVKFDEADGLPPPLPKLTEDPRSERAREEELEIELEELTAESRAESGAAPWAGEGYGGGKAKSRVKANANANANGKRVRRTPDAEDDLAAAYSGMVDIY